jgi:hypothetical protein
VFNSIYVKGKYLAILSFFCVLPLYAFELGLAFDVRNTDYHFEQSFLGRTNPNEPIKSSYLQTVGQAIFFKRLITPFLGLGVGKLTTNTTKQNVTSDEQVYKVIEEIYLVSELGAELIYKSLRWQLYGTYNYGLKGTDTTFIETSTNTDSQVNPIKSSFQLKIGTRLFYSFSNHFDLGLTFAYTCVGSFVDSSPLLDETSDQNHYFSGDSLGLTVRLRI